MMNTGEKLASIHTKINAIQGRLKGAEKNMKYSKCGDEESSGADVECAGQIPTKVGSSTCGGMRAKLCGCGKWMMELTRRKISGLRFCLQRQVRWLRFYKKSHRLWNSYAYFFEVKIKFFQNYRAPEMPDWQTWDLHLLHCSGCVNPSQIP